MSVQTSAEAKKQELIAKFGIRIGTAEWDEIRSYYSCWAAEVNKMFDYYTARKENIPEKYREMIDRQSFFFGAVRNVHDYMYMKQAKMSDFSGELAEYWIINPSYASYLVSYDGLNLQKRPASFQELTGFLALGVARECWTIEDALDHVASKCKVSKLLAED